MAEVENLGVARPPIGRRWSRGTLHSPSLIDNYTFSPTLSHVFNHFSMFVCQGEIRIVHWDLIKGLREGLRGEIMGK